MGQHFCDGSQFESDSHLKAREDMKSGQNPSTLPAGKKEIYLLIAKIVSKMDLPMAGKFFTFLKLDSNHKYSTVATVHLVDGVMSPRHVMRQSKQTPPTTTLSPFPPSLHSSHVSNREI